MKSQLLFIGIALVLCTVNVFGQMSRKNVTASLVTDMIIARVDGGEFEQRVVDKHDNYTIISTLPVNTTLAMVKNAVRCITDQYSDIVVHNPWSLLDCESGDITWWTYFTITNICGIIVMYKPHIRSLRVATR